MSSVVPESAASIGARHRGVEHRVLVERAVEPPPHLLQDLDEVPRRRRRPRHPAGERAVQVGVGVHQAGQDQASREVDGVSPPRRPRAALGDAVAVDAEVGRLDVRGIEPDQRRAREQHPGCDSSRDRGYHRRIDAAARRQAAGPRDRLLGRPRAHRRDHDRRRASSASPTPSPATSAIRRRSSRLWALFGVVSLCGALALAELASMLPHTGGVYVYLRHAYGDAAAFVFGWLFLLVSTPAAVGALAVFFAELLLGLSGRRRRRAPWKIPASRRVTILVLSIVNLLGARLGSAVQSVFTLLKVGALLVLIVVSFSRARRHLRAPAPARARRAQPRQRRRVRHLGLRRVDRGEHGRGRGAWRAEKTMRRVIVGGMLLIVFLYVGANVGYFYALPVAGDGGGDAAGCRSASCPTASVPWAATLIGAAILCSVFGALNGNILAKPRVAYAMARDGLTFAFLGRVHPRWATPHAAILIQGAMAVAARGHAARLRRPHHVFRRGGVVRPALRGGRGHRPAARGCPTRRGPFRTPAYPWVPLAFIARDRRGARRHRRGRGRPRDARTTRRSGGWSSPPPASPCTARGALSPRRPHRPPRPDVARAARRAPRRARRPRSRTSIPSGGVAGADHVARSRTRAGSNSVRSASAPTRIRPLSRIIGARRSRRARAGA